MAKQSEPQESAQNRSTLFKVAFEGDPGKPVDFMAHAFGPGGAHLASARVLDGTAEFPLDPKRLKGARIFFAPSPPQGEPKLPSLEDMQRLNAYEPLWHYDPRQRVYELLPIPEAIYKFWPFCSCRAVPRFSSAMR